MKELLIFAVVALGMCVEYRIGHAMGYKDGVLRGFEMWEDETIDFLKKREEEEKEAEDGSKEV